MNCLYFKDQKSMAQEAYSWCQTKITQNRAESIYVPAGSSPIPLYDLFESNRPEWLEDVTLVQVDDVCSGTKKGMFHSFFKQYLPHYYTRVTAPEPDQFQQADLAVLGLGVNGHIAFHEPHMGVDFKFGKVPLAEQTKLNLGLEIDAYGISYGAQAFLKAKAILLIVSGESKREVFHKLMGGEECPASLLLQHPDLTILCEESLRET